MARKYSNASRPTTLTVACNTTDTVITVNDVTGLPSSYPYALAADYEATNVEIMLVTAATGKVLTVTRGQEDTAAQAHSVGAVVVHAATALDFTTAATHVEATQDVHGIGAGNSVVGTGTAQTLTNKTISGVTLTATGAVKGSDLLIAGSPDRSVKTELDLANKPPRLWVYREPSLACPSGVITKIVWPQTVTNIGGWTVNGTTGEFNVPRDGYYQMQLNVWFTATINPGSGITLQISQVDANMSTEMFLFPTTAVNGLITTTEQYPVEASKKWYAGVYNAGATNLAISNARFHAYYVSAL